MTVTPAGAGRTPARRRPVSLPAAALAAAALTALSGCGTGRSAASDAGHQMPSPALRSSSTASPAVGAATPASSSPTLGDEAPDSVLTGTVARPAISVEGVAVRAQLNDSVSVLADIVGPVVPGEGLPVQQPTTTCTWTVTLTGPTGPVPIRAADFNSIDHLGTIYPAHLVPGQPVPPSTLLPGHTVTFELRSVMATGEGLMRWAPDGRHILASWDFTVEND